MEKLKRFLFTCQKQALFCLRRVFQLGECNFTKYLLGFGNWHLESAASYIAVLEFLNYVSVVLPFQQNFKQPPIFPRPGHVRCKSNSLASTVPVALLHFKGLRSRATGLHVQGGKTRLQMQPRRLHPQHVGTLCRVCPFVISQRNKLLIEGWFFNTAPGPSSYQTRGAVLAKPWVR